MRRKEVCVYYRTDSSVAAHVLRRQVVSTYKAQAEGYDSLEKVTLIHRIDSNSVPGRIARYVSCTVKIRGRASACARFTCTDCVTGFGLGHDEFCEKSSIGANRK
jgi:hypothetical protein